jgi:NIMA (never in mitosis gene a)-related kinase
MYELCCFKPPFRSKSMDELFKRIQSGTYDRIPKRYSFMLEDTISLCLQKRSKRASVDQLIEIFEKYSSNAPQVLKKVVSSSTLLSTIEFPKDKNDFSQVLPSPKYDCAKESVSEVFTSKRPSSGVKENVLNRYLKPEASLVNKRKRLTNEVYYADRQDPELKEIRSEKLLPEASI